MLGSNIDGPLMSQIEHGGEMAAGASEDEEVPEFMG